MRRHDAMSSRHRKSKEKADRPGKETSGSERKKSGSGSILAVGFVFMIFLLPIGLCFYSAPAEPYTVVSEDPLLTAVHQAGATICDTTNTRWNVAGATGGKTYVISTDCRAQSDTNTITVQVQAFDSQESRDAAVLAYNTMTVGRGKPVGNLFAYDQYLIYVTPPNTDLMRQIGAELKKIMGSG
ncbi:MAG: hypothetical protein LUQ67_07940 [Methanomicrobiales archaeon]|nr:hypothetical protein [Methanomicrobiales archaeon]